MLKESTIDKAEGVREMKRDFVSVFNLLMILLLSVSVGVIIPQLAFSAQPIIIDHTSTDIRQIPESAIEQAKTIFTLPTVILPMAVN